MRHLLTSTEIHSLLRTQTLGRGLIEIHPQIESTNLRAHQLAMAGQPEGTLILAETQTAGRGRLGRTWHSPPGQGLYFSVILRPLLPLQHLPLITLAAGLGACEALTLLTGEFPRIKWPNDIQIRERKIAGVLTEMEMRDQEAHFVILGLGLNVNLTLEELPPDIADRAGSLLIATGRTWMRAAVLSAVLHGIEVRYRDLSRGSLEELLRAYRLACETLGQDVSIAQGQTMLTGHAVDIDSLGRLVIQPSDGGQPIHIGAGEITRLRPRCSADGDA